MHTDTRARATVASAPAPRLASGARTWHQGRAVRRSRLLVIGLDAAEPALLRRWCASGHLPVLRRLLATGTWGEIDSGSAEFPDAAMLSAYTGMRPARLGRYFFIQPRRDRPGLELLHDGLVAEPFWVTAGRHGRRCVVVDTPKIGLRPPADGVHVVGWGAHGFNEPLVSHPPGLAAELLGRHGRYPHTTCDDHGRTRRSYRRLRQRLLEGVAVRRRLLCDLMARGEWDLFVAVFAETHCAGHNLWYFQDPAPPGARADPELGSALRDVYVAVDTAIGALLDAAGPAARVVLFSSQGMRPQYHGRDLVPALLDLWGLRAPAVRPPGTAPEVRVRVSQPLAKALRDRVPLPLQYVVKRCLPRPLTERLLCRFMGVWSLDRAARAYQVPNNEMTPAIRINRRDRDPWGIVAPGAEADTLCAFLAARLRELVNPATGGPALAAVHETDAGHDGPYRDRMPDLTGYWSPAAPITALYSPGYGTMIGGHRDVRTGGHGPHGLLCIGGHAGQLTGGHIADVAPTVLDLLGVPAADTLDGRSALAPG